MSTTAVSPVTFGQQQTDLGVAFQFAAEAIDMELTEQLDVIGLGLVRGIGDLAGSGTDTLRAVHYGGVGHAETFQSLNETEAIVPTGYTSDYDTLTIGRYGLAKEESYQAAILQTPAAKAALGLDALALKLGQSWIATIRTLWAAELATFTDSVGTTGVVWNMDDELDLAASFREREGYDPVVHGLPVAARHPLQFTQLGNAVRSEPGLANNAALIESFMGIEKLGKPFGFLGLQNVASHDVVSSGGDLIGGAYVPGAVAFCVASTSPAPVQDPTRTIYLPNWGLLIEFRSNPDGAVAKVTANAWLGMNIRSRLVYPATKIRSLNA